MGHWPQGLAMADNDVAGLSYSDSGAEFLEQLGTVHVDAEQSLEEALGAMIPDEDQPPGPETLAQTFSVAAFRARCVGACFPSAVILVRCGPVLKNALLRDGLRGDGFFCAVIRDGPAVQQQRAQCHISGGARRERHLSKGVGESRVAWPAHTLLRRLDRPLAD